MKPPFKINEHILGDINDLPDRHAQIARIPAHFFVRCAPWRAKRGRLGLNAYTLDHLKTDRFSPDLTPIANAIRARELQIKKKECIVPKGFEEMKALICKDQSS